MRFATHMSTPRHVVSVFQCCGQCCCRRQIVCKLHQIALRPVRELNHNKEFMVRVRYVCCACGKSVQKREKARHERTFYHCRVRPDANLHISYGYMYLEPINLL